jgi:hypothetical protein
MDLSLSAKDHLIPNSSADYQISCGPESDCKRARVSQTFVGRVRLLAVWLPIRPLKKRRNSSPGLKIPHALGISPCYGLGAQSQQAGIFSRNAAYPRTSWFFEVRLEAAAFERFAL